MNKKSQFTVLGKPFFSIGGQTHNSSSYYPEDMDRSFRSVKELGGNTVATPLCWDRFEPEEGRFDDDYVRRIIDQARKWELHLVFLWFATWKNGTMEYTPPWVKLDTVRFPRTLCHDLSPTSVLSCHNEASRAADEKAFCQLMKVLKEYDENVGTVIAVQVENEPGIIGATRRDFGPDGARDFAADVPQKLIDYMKAHPDGRLYGFWKDAGGKERGNWTEMFGRYGAEAVSAWHTARYIDSIAAAGKKVYDLFLYANAWLDGGENGANWDVSGLEYPSGGPVSKSLEVWYAACEALDVIAPDNYQSETERHLEVSRYYAHPEEGWPLYIPESHAAGLNSTMMFYAIGEMGAIGYHIFACESCLDNDGNMRDNAKIMQRSMKMLANASGLIQEHRNDGKMHAIYQRAGESASHMSLKGWKCRVCFTGHGYGWNAMDFRHRESIMEETTLETDVHGETGRGLLFEISENEFYLVGHKLRLLFNRYEPEDGSLPPTFLNPSHQANSMGTLIIEEGSFIDGKYVPVRTRSGDEARHGIWAQSDCDVIHFILAD